MASLTDTEEKIGFDELITTFYKTKKSTHFLRDELELWFAKKKIGIMISFYFFWVFCFQEK